MDSREVVHFLEGLLHRRFDFIMCYTLGCMRCMVECTPQECNNFVRCFSLLIACLVFSRPHPSGSLKFSLKHWSVMQQLTNTSLLKHSHEVFCRWHPVCGVVLQLG